MKSKKDILDFYINSIQFCDEQLKHIEKCDNLNDAVVGTAEDYMRMKKLNIEKYVNEVHHRNIYEQRKSRKDGSSYYLWVTKVEGKKRISGATKEKLYEKLYKHYTGQNTFLENKKRHTLKALFPKFMTEWKQTQNIKGKPISGKTLQEYIRRWETYYVDAPIANECIESIEPTTWEQFFKSIILEHKLTRRQFFHVRTVATELCAFAVTTGLLPYNPIKSLDYSHMPLFEEEAYNTVKSKAFTENELAAIEGWCYRELNNPRKRAIYPLAILLNRTLGARYGELTGLTWKDVDFKKRTILIRGQMVNDMEMTASLRIICHGKKLSTHLKKGEKPRLLPLTDEALDVLDRIKNLNLNSEFVFPLGQFRYKTFNDKIKEVAEAIGLSKENYHTHCLRSSAATFLYDQTKNIYMVQSHLGHTNIEMTSKYIQSAPVIDETRAALETMSMGKTKGGYAPKFSLVS